MKNQQSDCRKKSPLCYKSSRAFKCCIAGHENFEAMGVRIYLKIFGFFKNCLHDFQYSNFKKSFHLIVVLYVRYLSNCALHAIIALNQYEETK